MTRLDARAPYWSQVLPGILVFGFGLASMVAPLTAATLGGLNPAHAGMASAINNAIARVAGLVTVAALGPVLSGAFSDVVDRYVSVMPLTGPARLFLLAAKGHPLDTSVPWGLDSGVVRPILEQASVHALHVGLGWIAALLAMGGIASAVGIQDPPRT